MGNDIKIKWAIYTGSGINMTPYNLEGKKVAVYLKNKYHKIPAQDISVSEHIVTFYFYGKDQYEYGPYSIEFIENDGSKGMHTVDECKAFELVKCTCEADGAGGEGLISVTSLEFRTSLQVGMDGSDNNIVVDTELSSVSTNPLQNKVITAALDEIKEELKLMSSYEIVEEILPPDGESNLTDYATVQWVQDQVGTITSRVDEIENAMLQSLDK